MASSLPLEIGHDTEPSKPAQLVSTAGIPVGNLSASLTVGCNAHVLLEDLTLLEAMTHFNRERVPERGVHAKGIGLYGVFKVTHDNSRYCSAPILSELGYQCRVFVRFSTIVGQSGSSDAARDLRGFAFRMFTEQGNNDLLMISTPVFPVNDPMLFTLFNHSQKRNPQTNLLDPSAVWDFITLHEETIHAMLYVFSHHGIPDGYEHMNGFACHAFKLTNAEGKFVYAKFKLETDQGEKFLNPDEAVLLSGKDSDYANRKLLTLIKQRKYPTWTLRMQVATAEQVQKIGFFYSDVTMVWDEEKHPWIPIGKLSLNEVPDNFFEHSEQAGFCVTNLPKDIQGNQDRVFNLRSFAYGDAQRYRTGVNSTQLTVNRPLNPVHNYLRDGQMCRGNQGSAVNYFQNSYGGPQPNPIYNEAVYNLCGEVKRCETPPGQQIVQARQLYHSFTEEQKKGLSLNLANSVGVARLDIRDRAIDLFNKVDHKLGASVRNDIAIMKLTPEP